MVLLPSGGCWRWCESFGVYFELVSHLLTAVVEGSSRSIPLVYFERRAIYTGTCSSVSSKGCFQTGVQREGGCLCNSSLSCLSPKKRWDLKHSYQCPVRQLGCLFASGSLFLFFSRVPDFPWSLHRGLA